MGFQCILSDGKLIQPGVDVLSGDIKAIEANRLYQGVSGICPHCQELRDSQYGTDNFHVLQALSIADLTVRFRRAVLDGDRVERIMHFAHRPGFLAGAVACRLCRDQDLAKHAAAVKVIGRWAENQWPHCIIKAEMQILIPGAPPRQFRPDVSVINDLGQHVACIEFQRSKEAFEAFKARDQLRCSEFGQVIWMFHGNVYNLSRDHRDYLADQGRQFFKTSVDANGRLQYEIGKRPARRLAFAKPRRLGSCSEESLLRVIDSKEPQQRGQAVAINTKLDFKEKLRDWQFLPENIRKLHPELGWLHDQARRNYFITVGAMVQKWSTCEKRYLSGWEVVKIEDNQYTIKRPGFPGCLTVDFKALRLADE